MRRETGTSNVGLSWFFSDFFSPHLFSEVHAEQKRMRMGSEGGGSNVVGFVVFLINFFCFQLVGLLRWENLKVDSFKCWSLPMWRVEDWICLRCNLLLISMCRE